MNEASLYRCLASPTRAAALRLLARGERSVGDLAEGIEVEQSNLSHQLRELRDCGIVLSRQEGKRVLYRLAHPSITHLLALGQEIAHHLEGDAEACMPGCC